RKVSTPIFMTQAEILSSLDCYPIEFLSMKRHYTVVSGPDILSTLTFKPSYLRLQAERELKAKILHLRRGFLDAEGNARRIRELIKPSFTAFISIFRALLYLKGADIPHSQRDIVHAMAREYSIAPAVFLACADVKEGVDRISASEIRNILVDYMKEIEKLSAAVDSMNV
ncbi:MAG TPA: hypothetical protein VLZ07_00595, partial [Syntrophales bacterium]|nr:hypothetical protein [Syntrophales bacterium]